LARLKLDQDALGLSFKLERLAKIRVKDCFKNDETIFYVVSNGDLGRALGKGAVNIKKLQQELGKYIRIVEFREDLIGFVKNVIYPVKAEEIVQEDENTILIKDSRKKAKSLLIGRGGKNLQLINRAVRRFFNVEVRVV